MRHEQQTRSASAQPKQPRNARQGRVREVNTPVVRRGRQVPAAKTRLEPEADSPLATVRQLVAPMPVARDRDAPSYSRRELFEEHVRVQVVLRLADHAVDRWPIHVAVEGARVEIYGVVPDALTSQLAEDLVWSVPAVRQCENRLRVA